MHLLCILDKLESKFFMASAECLITKIGCLRHPDRELILEALKYEFSDTKELNTLITLSQSDNLRPYGKKVIQDLIKNNSLGQHLKS